MTDTAHLTEAECQTLADSVRLTRHTRRLQAHLRACSSCAADVARLRLIARRYAEPAPRDPRLPALWPEIRARIEQKKVVPLDPDADAPVPRTRRRGIGFAAIAAGGLAAAIAAALWLGPTWRSNEAAATDSLQALVLVADSVRSYREEAQVLLDRLELQRAMLRPDAMASIDRDLGVIDRSIAELELAIERDPRNPVLRHLLASSWRQKVEVLKRVGNAG